MNVDQLIDYLISQGHITAAELDKRVKAHKAKTEADLTSPLTQIHKRSDDLQIMDRFVMDELFSLKQRVAKLEQKVGV